MGAQHTPGQKWEIGTYSGGQEILKEVGPMGRFLFDIAERPGLGIDAKQIRATMVAAPELLEALVRIVEHANRPIPLEQHGDPAKLMLIMQCMADEARAAIPKARGEA